METISTARSVSMGVWIRTGTRDETPAQNGISHFLEHMFFKGTSTHTARQLAEVFDGIGGQVNAFTTKEYTCFHARVLDEHAVLALSTLADMMFDSLLDEKELEREKRVILEEIKMYEDNPEELVHDLIVEHVYPDHPLGANILGTEQSLSGIDRAMLQDYVEHRYTPREWVISLSGRLDPDGMMTELERLFGSFRRSPLDLLDKAPVFAVGERYEARPVEQVHVCLATPGYAYDDERTYALALLNNILGASSSSRLFQEIREERGLAYNVFSYHNAYRDCGLLSLYFGSSPGQAQTVLDVLLETVRGLVAKGVTDAELHKAKNQVKGSLILSMESTSSRMSRIGKNLLLLGRQVEWDETIGLIERVSASDVRKVAQELFSGPLSMLAIGPDSRPLQLRVGRWL